MIFPRHMNKKFKLMRGKFYAMTTDVKDIFKNSKGLNAKSLRGKIRDCIPDLSSQLAGKKTIDSVLDVIKGNCTIVDVSHLEVIAIALKNKKAQDVIKDYKKEVEIFCSSVTVDLCLHEKLQAIPVPHRSNEKFTFVLNWEPDDSHTLKDIIDVLEVLKPLSVYIIEVKPSQSVAVACYCPAECITLLIITVFAKMEILEERGLKEFIIGDCTIWNVADNISFKITSPSTSTTRHSLYGSKCSIIYFQMNCVL